MQGGAGRDAHLESQLVPLKCHSEMSGGTWPVRIQDKIALMVLISMPTKPCCVNAMHGSPRIPLAPVTVTSGVFVSSAYCFTLEYHVCRSRGRSGDVATGQGY